MKVTQVMRRAAQVAAASAALAIVPAIAGAQSVSVAGSTQGCYDFAGALNCTPTNNVDNASGTGFDFNNASFGPTTLSVGGSQTINLGTLRLGEDGDNLNANGTSNFLLRVNFTVPVGATQENVSTDILAYCSILAGCDGFFGWTGAAFSFDNAVVNFNGGSFLLSIADVSIDTHALTNTPSSAQIVGTISGLQVVPEPSTYMLLATGLGALGLVARRRRTHV